MGKRVKGKGARLAQVTKDHGEGKSCKYGCTRAEPLKCSECQDQACKERKAPFHDPDPAPVPVVITDAGKVVPDKTGTKPADQSKASPGNEKTWAIIVQNLGKGNIHTDPSSCPQLIGGVNGPRPRVGNRAAGNCGYKWAPCSVEVCPIKDDGSFVPMMDQRLAKAGTPIGNTTLKCDMCGKANFEIVKGTETPRMLKCPGCGQYYYIVGGTVCCMTVVIDRETHEVRQPSGAPPTIKEIRDLLGNDNAPV